MTKDVRMIITIEIENSRRMTINYMILSDTFGQKIREIQKRIGEMISEAVIESYDNRIRKEEAKGLKVLGRETRVVEMECGKVAVKRRVYQRKDGRRWKPIDELLGLEKYQRRDEKVMERNCVLAAQTTYRRTAEISSYLNEKAISASTIGRDVKRVGGKIAAQEKAYRAEEGGKIRSEILNCESDGILISLQKEKKHKAEIRMAIAYTGKKWISGNRYRLQNKLSIMAMDVTTEKWQEMICERMYSKYDLGSVSLLAVGGDGGKWVGSSFDLVGVKQIERVLDPFHINKAIREAYGKEIDVPDTLKTLYRDGFDAVATELQRLKDQGSASARKAKNCCFEYLKNHQDEILPLSARGLPYENLAGLGCMESNVGKSIALRMKTRGCSWSRSGAEAMVAILSHITELSDHTFRYQEIRAKDQRKGRTSRRRKSKVSEYCGQHASFPILNAGKASVPYFNLFRNIIHSELPS